MRLYSVFLFVCFLSFSQAKKKPINTVSKPVDNGFELSIDTKNLINEKITLNLVYGIEKKLAIVDSATVKQDNEKIILKNKNKILGSIYILRLESVGKPIFLAIDNGQKVDFELHSTEISLLKALNSVINKDFIEYQNKKNEFTTTQLIEKRTAILKKYPTSILNLYFRVENKIDDPIPVSLDERTKFHANFFASIDKSDKRLFLLPNVYRLLYQYVNTLPLSNENYIRCIDFMFSNLNCSSKNYGTFAKWFLSNLTFYEPKNLESSFVHLYKKYIDLPNCKLLNESEASIASNKFNTILKIPLESKVPELNLIDSKSKAYKLSEIYPENDFTYLMFFSPDCVHCQESAPKVNATLENLKLKFPNKKIQFISILNDRNDKDWEKFIKEKKIDNWLNLKPLLEDKNYQATFNSYSNPSYVLVDKEGKIVLKTYNQKAIEEVILGVK